ncbi:hypothetical protein HK097_009428, partial [Rhizophlyctis rosea]
MGCGALSQSSDAGDVLGVTINLPPREDGIDDLIKRSWNFTGDTRYMKFRAPPMDVVPGSEIRFFRSGEDLGVAFRDLYRGQHRPYTLAILSLSSRPQPTGKYHPAISCFHGCSVTVNFGPDFRYPIPEGARAMCDANMLPLWEEIREGKNLPEGSEMELESGYGTPVDPGTPVGGNV